MLQVISNNLYPGNMLALLFGGYSPCPWYFAFLTITLSKSNLRSWGFTCLDIWKNVSLLSSCIHPYLEGALPCFQQGAYIYERPGFQWPIRLTITKRMYVKTRLALSTLTKGIRPGCSSRSLDWFYERHLHVIIAIRVSGSVPVQMPLVTVVIVFCLLLHVALYARNDINISIRTNIFMLYITTKQN